MSGDDISRAAGFTRHDRRRLTKALAHAREARFFRRLQAVLFVAEGVPVSEAARRARVDRSTLHRWLGWYWRRRDPQDLADAPRAGRPSVTEALTDSAIATLLARDPRREGFAATTWTVPLLTTYLARRPGQRVSARTLRRRLHSLGYRWKRPRYVYTGQEPHLAQKKGRSSGA
jgi:transposase